jgi:molybdopterin-guanine dinucleotide biosynthesis protein A
MQTAPPFAAIILCGGESRRMGRAKAMLPWQGRTLLEHIAATLAPIATPLIVVAAPEQELPPLQDEVAIVRDAIAGEGPLRGLEAGLSALVGRAEVAFVCGCDMPEISPAVVAELQKRGQNDLLNRSEPFSAIVVDDGGYWQPLHAFYRVDLLNALRAALSAGERSPQRWLRTVKPLVVPAEELRAVDPELRSLRNVNTPGEYEAFGEDSAARLR